MDHSDHSVIQLYSLVQEKMFTEGVMSIKWNNMKDTREIFQGIDRIIQLKSNDSTV